MKSKDHTTLPLTIHLHHGEGFDSTSRCTAMQVYVKARIEGDKNKAKATKVPIRNSQMEFNLDLRRLLFLGQGGSQSLELILKVKASSPLFLVSKKIGEVRLPIKDLYNRVAAKEMMTWTSHRSPVVSRSGRLKGALHFSYRFGNHGDEVEYCGNAGVATASAPPLPPIGLYGDDLGEFI